MKVEITGEPKEIAALVVAIQGRRDTDNVTDAVIEEINNRAGTTGEVPLRI